MSDTLLEKVAMMAKQSCGCIYSTMNTGKLIREFCDIHDPSNTFERIKRLEEEVARLNKIIGSDARG